MSTPANAVESKQEKTSPQSPDSPLPVYNSSNKSYTADLGSDPRTGEWPAVDDVNGAIAPTVVEDSQDLASAALPGDFRAVGSQEHASKFKYVLRAEEVCASNVDEGRALAELCFRRLEDLEQLRREYDNLTGGIPLFYEPALAHEILIHADLLFRLDGVPVAMAGVYQYPEESDRMWLSWFGVHPEHRRNGFGAAVLRHCEEVAQELGAKFFAAYTEDDQANAKCHRFYEALGYVETAKCIIDGEEMRIYQKSLSPTRHS